MMASIAAVSITGLNGRINVRLPLHNGHCVIVGPNGSGKSTALQIISFALGRQWKQLASLRFETVSIEFGSATASLKRTTCSSIFAATGLPGRFGRVYRSLLEVDQLEAFLEADLTKSAATERFRAIAPATVADLRLAQRLGMKHEDRSAQAELAAFQKVLDENEVPKALYLPTSRRIEFDISRVTDRMPEYVKHELVRALRAPQTGDFFEEVLQFGMDDIQALISEFERQTRDFSRNRFNKMMSHFLKEMANSQSISIHDLRSFQIDQKRVDAVLSRIEEGLLDSVEKSEIGNIVMSMARPQKGGHPPFHKRWLAHFFVRLLEVDEDIEEREQPIRALVRDLSKYLSPKKVSYDIESYHFSIADKRGDELKLGDLSSGEKQLVSLLTILQLSERGSVNVLIDEPELSLSVPWQAEFLPDVARARSCNQLFAVTHSPFIYENSLADSVVDFLECASDL
jgi:predicted ATPase